MVTDKKRFTVTKLAPSRYVGVREAARGIGVRKQAIYAVLAGLTYAIGPEKRKMLRIVDRTK